jgi:hypothetical protein
MADVTNADHTVLLTLLEGNTTVFIAWQAWRKRWLVMEFPQQEEEEGEREELRSVLVRVYSSHIHENRKADM